jgi:para-aminobenzoate synthetase component I
MHLFIASLAGWVQPADVYVQFYAAEENAFWLDGEHSTDSRFSVLGAGSPASKSLTTEEALQIFELDSAGDWPFRWRPGLVGFISYEGEETFLVVDRAVVFDHDKQSLYFVGAFENQSDFDFWHHGALLRLGLSGGQVANYLHAAQPIEQAPSARLRHPGEKYLGLIAEAQKHIEAGDVYQICLTNQIEVATQADPLSVFLRLRANNPAPYSAFIKIGDRTVVSSSPEQFILAGSDGSVSTKPIKGTRPRGASEAEDREIMLELSGDSKETAENLMIVDLMRNDLGKVSEVGSVAVPKLFDVETYATVHQLVSTVTGQLAQGETAWTAVKAAFPGGSMTGAPKIRAMEIIRELEQGERGIYSGCLGYLSGDGSAEFAMVIRSITFESGVARIGVGGGITIDSDPLAELEETKLKAKALLSALNAPDPWA